MKIEFKFYLYVKVFFCLNLICFYCCSYSQSLNRYIARLDSIEYVEGVSLQQGGAFTDPVSTKGLSLSSDLGLMESKQVFGYDALTFNARWVPGTNAVGSRVSLNLGTANWLTPGLSQIYIDTVLTEEERFQQSVTNSVWIAGVGISMLRPNIFSNWKAADLDQVFQKYKQELNSLGVLEENAIADPTLKEKYELETSRLLFKIAREQARKSRWIVGGNFRLLNLGQSSNVDVLELYSTFARGKGIMDFSASVHYLAPREKSFLFRDAVTLSAGVFLDLDQEPPVNTLALIFRYGHYLFREKKRTIDTPVGAIEISDSPFIHTFDGTLTFSGLRGKHFFGGGLGIRYGIRWNKGFDPHSEFSILFTSKFVQDNKR